jgi:hypothetical protein
MSSPSEEQRLRRELEAARDLCGAQLSKIRRLEQEVARLRGQLDRARATIEELVVSTAATGPGLD